MGPLMIGLEAEALGKEDRRRLATPAVGGVILFTRNFRDTDQLAGLTAQIREIHPQLLIAVDHEGGRVQRFRQGLTPIPAMGRLGRIYQDDPEAAKQMARHCGWIMAAELRALGLDFSFAPILDLDYGHSSVIGDRSFHRQPVVVATLARALMAGMADAGMAAVGKHFPGHGYVAADSHLALPVDERPFSRMKDDLAAFRALIDAGLAGIMPAHVVYSAVDSQPAGYSPVWLGRILRGTMGFDGLIFSDDLAMAGARGAGRVSQRALQALQAGCDMVLVCNHTDEMDEAIEALADSAPVKPERFARLVADRAPAPSLELLRQQAQWQTGVASLNQLAAELDD